MRAWDKEKKKAAAARYYQKHKDRLLQEKKQYADENKEKIKEKKRSYYERNKEKIKAKKKDYYYNNQDKIREYGKKYYTKERNRTYYENYVLKNPEKYKQLYSLRRKKYYLNNKEKLIEKNKDYYHSNKDKVLQYVKAYKESKRRVKLTEEKIRRKEEFRKIVENEKPIPYKSNKYTLNEYKNIKITKETGISNKPEYYLNLSKEDLIFITNFDKSLPKAKYDFMAKYKTCSVDMNKEEWDMESLYFSDYTNEDSYIELLDLKIGG